MSQMIYLNCMKNIVMNFNSNTKFDNKYNLNKDQKNLFNLIMIIIMNNNMDLINGNEINMT